MAVDHVRIAELKRQRGYFAAFGQTEKVRAVDLELAKLRRGADEPPSTRDTKPTTQVETATADTSSVETADRPAARKRAAARRRPAASDDD